MAIDKDKLVEHFATYDRIGMELDECKLQTDKLIQMRSETVKLILEANGGEKHIIRKGKEMSIVDRDPTYFIRGSKVSKNVTEID